jgi:hypothetical protein
MDFLHMMPIILHVNLGLTKAPYNNEFQHFPENILLTTINSLIAAWKISKSTFVLIVLECFWSSAKVREGRERAAWAEEEEEEKRHFVFVRS